jgi:hypothetical protein
MESTRMMPRIFHQFLRILETEVFPLIPLEHLQVALSQSNSGPNPCDQNVRGLRMEGYSFFDSVDIGDRNIYCITESRMNDAVTQSSALISLPTLSQRVVLADITDTPMQFVEPERCSSLYVILWY